MNEPWVIYVLVFAAAVLAVEALYWLVYRARDTKKAINRRLALGKQLSSQSQVLDVLRQERGFADFNNAMLSGLNEIIVQTGLRMSKGTLLLWTALVGLVASALATPIFGLHAASIACGIVLGPIFVWLFVLRTRAKRIARFAGQLPEAIEIIVRGLRVGHPFSSAIELVARELPDPIGSEFGMTADEIAFGQETTKAIDSLYRRVGQDDLLFVAIAVSVQAQTGGNLAEILARLARLIRERSNLRLKVKALSAEGRMSGWFLTAMPFILFGVVSLLAPNYFSEVRQSAALVPAIVYGAASLLIGNYAIYRMVNFKI